MDNSGGVDLSDHEVNITILLDLLVKKGKVANREERNRILAEMTEEVADLVLAEADVKTVLDGSGLSHLREGHVIIVSP